MNKPFPPQMSKYRSYKGDDQTGNRKEEHADQRYGHEQRIYRSSVRRSLKKTGRDETKHGNDKNYQRYRCQNLCSSVSFLRLHIHNLFPHCSCDRSFCHIFSQKNIIMYKFPFFYQYNNGTVSFLFDSQPRDDTIIENESSNT